jgi:predicted 3-demethylubiquinone-9 3-methyltransferase (glyoxalase superfamily)
MTLRNRKTRTITPFLWFDDRAEEAAKFYTSIFKNSSIGQMTRYSEASEAAAGRPAGSVMTVDFRLDGQDFVALNGGPHFKFNEAVSFVVSCTTQREVNRYWRRLSAGGREIQCGWLQDKFGLYWQIVPTILGELLTDRDRTKAERVTTAMLQMVKLDIKKLQAAARRK